MVVDDANQNNLVPAYRGDGNILSANFLQVASNIRPSAPVYATAPIQDPAHSGTKEGSNFQNDYAASGYGDYRPYAASAYAATMLLIQAIRTTLQDSGVSTPHGVQDQDGAKKFRQAVLKVLADPSFTYTGITGKHRFDTNGDTTNHTVSFYQLDLSKPQADWTWFQQVNA
jgi:ABC-type branched-subunit amino acid transport system substrate-binding protein